MARARTELIHCDNCGEDYAATYRRCPFCDAKPGSRREPEPEYEEPFDDDELDLAPVSRQGGKRLAGGSQRGRGGSDKDVAFWLKIGLYAVSAVVILAAIWIVCSLLFPRLFPAGTQETDAPAEPTAAPTQAAAQPTAEPAGTEYPPIVLPGDEVDDPLSLDSPDLPAVEPDPIATTQPLPSQTPVATATPVAALKLSSTDFTLSPKYPTYQMEIDGVGRAQATYVMDNEGVATVSSSGLITAVGNGTTKLTVTDKNGNAATCIVRVSGMSAAAQAPAAQAPASETPASQVPASQAPSSSGSASLNHTDFTINAAYPDPVRLKVKNGEAAGWSSSNTGVATVSDNGTVTAVGNGSAKITCTLADGAKLTAVVRVQDK